MQKLEVLKFIQYGLLESDSVWRPYELHNEEKTYNEEVFNWLKKKKRKKINGDYQLAGREGQRICWGIGDGIPAMGLLYF